VNGIRFAGLLHTLVSQPDRTMREMHAAVLARTILCQVAAAFVGALTISNDGPTGASDAVGREKTSSVRPTEMPM
jgi:hypothetical protein